MARSGLHHDLEFHSEDPFLNVNVYVFNLQCQHGVGVWRMRWIVAAGGTAMHGHVRAD